MLLVKYHTRHTNCTQHRGNTSKIHVPPVPTAFTTGIARRTNELTLGTGKTHLVHIEGCSVIAAAPVLVRSPARGAGSSLRRLKSSNCSYACQAFQQIRVTWWIVVNQCC